MPAAFCEPFIGYLLVTRTYLLALADAVALGGPTTVVPNGTIYILDGKFLHIIPVWSLIQNNNFPHMFVLYAYSCFFTTSVFVKLEAVSLGHRWRTRETTPQEQAMVKREIEWRGRSKGESPR